MKSIKDPTIIAQIFDVKKIENLYNTEENQNSEVHFVRAFYFRIAVKNIETKIELRVHFGNIFLF